MTYILTQAERLHAGIPGTGEKKALFTLRLNKLLNASLLLPCFARVNFIHGWVVFFFF